MDPDIGYKIEIIHNTIYKAASVSGRSTDSVKLLGVTKQVDEEKIITALKAGLVRFGENYVQELVAKYDLIPRKYLQKIEWHFIGHLQSNKVKYIIDKVTLIHSVDKFSLAQEIDKRSEKLGKKSSILIEVNLGGEDSKSGVSASEVETLLESISGLNYVEAIGLMAIPPLFDDPEKSRPYFIKLRQLRDKLRISYNSLKELSMGMSADYDVAIEEGATIIRIGTAIFGERPT